MEIIAQSKSVKIAPRKVRLVVDALRRKSIREAIDMLKLIRKRSAGVLMKVLKSAISNAANTGKLKEDDLAIKSIDVFEGPSLKRYRPSTRGRVHPYKKRSSHIKIILEVKKGLKD